jgi:hypothetical protein
VFRHLKARNPERDCGHIGEGRVGQDLALRASRRKRCFGISEIRRSGNRCHRELGNPEGRNHISCGKLFGCIRAVKEKEGPVDRFFNRDSSEESKSRFGSKGNLNDP